MNPVEGRNFGLDLIRATAVLLVVVGHCTVVFCSWNHIKPPPALVYGSFVGVELFFVLSGFLVGGLAIDAAAWAAPGTWFAFMRRRWLRTLPLYYLWMAVLLLIWPPLYWQPDAAAQRVRAALIFGSFMQNFAWPTASGNWFGVSWSLAVEEWFYLLLPAGLIVLTPRIGRWRAVGLMLALLLAGPALARAFVFNPADMPHAVIATLDQIALGVVLAAVQRARPGLFAQALWAAPLGALCYAAFWVLPEWGWMRLPPIVVAQRMSVMGVGMALLIPAALRLPAFPGAAGWLVRRISTYSYGIYIMHLSVLELVDAYHHGRGVAAGLCVAEALALIVILPVLSWHFYETRWLARRPDVPRAAAAHQ